MKTLIQVFSLALACAAGAQGVSEEAITDYSSSVAGPFNGTAGWTFKPNTSFAVTDLGALTNVVVDNAGPISVGLWYSDGTLLRSNSVSVSGELVNRTFYSSVEPIWLVPLQTYHIGVFSPSGLFLQVYDSLSGDVITVSSRLQLVGMAETAGAFAFPAAVVGGEGAIWLGANFRHVPEPAIGLLLGAGLTALWFGRRRSLGGS